MNHQDIINKYGWALYEKIIADGYMQGITITIADDGQDNIPESDVLRAVKHIKGEDLSNSEWD